MRSKISLFIAALFAVVLLLPFSVLAAEEQTLSYKDENGNSAVVKDDAGLYSEQDRKALLEQIRELLPYGNIGIETSEMSNNDAAAYARSEYISMFGETDGTLFLIDMYNRRIQIFSGGEVYKTISQARANEITDNIYTYASDGDYYQATKKAFEQIKIILEGGRIVTPMRYATNAALAIGIVLLVNFIIITAQRKNKDANKLTNALVYASGKRKTSVVQNVSTVMTKQTKVRRSQSTGGGGFSGGGGGFSGGGGGGGFSGGGGGHSF